MKRMRIHLVVAEFAVYDPDELGCRGDANAHLCARCSAGHDRESGSSVSDPGSTFADRQPGSIHRHASARVTHSWAV